MFIHLPFFPSPHESETSPIFRYIEILNTALANGFSSIKAENIVKKSIIRKNTDLIIHNHKISIKGKNLFIIGGGKATFEIVEALIPILGDYFTSGIINIPKSQFDCEVSLPRTTIIKTGHPYPDQDTFSGTEKQITLVSSLTEKDIVFVVITGGASALFELPEAQLDYDNIIETYKQLVISGLPINEINTIRKHLSQVKGGKLLSKTKAQIIGLLVSDVPGDDLSTIGSGPTITSSTSYQKCLNILKRNSLLDALPIKISEFITFNAGREQNNTLDRQNNSQTPLNFLLSSNRTILKSIQDSFQEHHIPTEICSSSFNGEAKEIAKFLFDYTTFPYTGVPKCLLFGGESVVTISKNNLPVESKGGRNQELILSYIYHYIQKESIYNILIVSLGTDGVDGNSPYAGAFFTNDVKTNSGLQVNILKNYLSAHNSSNALPLHYYINIGPTGTNVGDILIVFKY